MSYRIDYSRLIDTIFVFFDERFTSGDEMAVAINSAWADTDELLTSSRTTLQISDGVKEFQLRNVFLQILFKDNRFFIGVIPNEPGAFSIRN